MYRYGNYQIKKSQINGNYLGINYYNSNESKIVIYDISKGPLGETGIYEKKYMMTAILLNITSQYSLDFGFNTSQSLATNGKSIGLLYWIDSTNFVYQDAPPIRERIIHKDIEL